MLILPRALVLLLKFVAGFFLLDLLFEQRKARHSSNPVLLVSRRMSGGSGKSLVMLWLHKTEPHQCGSGRLKQASQFRHNQNIALRLDHHLPHLEIV